MCVDMQIKIFDAQGRDGNGNERKRFCSLCCWLWQWEAGSDNFTLATRPIGMKAFAESREVHLEFRSNPKDSHLSQSDILH